MKEKIFNALKQAYSSLGLSDAILSLHAGLLAESGAVSDENLTEIVGKQGDYLKGLQSENDKRVNTAVETARKKFQDEDADKKKKAEDAAKAKAEAERLEAEKAEKERIERERIDKLEGFEKQFAQWKLEQEKQREAEKADWEKRLADLLGKNKAAQDSVDALNKQLAEREAVEKRNARLAMIESKAKELGISDNRIKEGFVIADDADDTAIADYLTTVANNQKAMAMPQRGFGLPIQSDTTPTKEEIDSIAASLLGH